MAGEIWSEWKGLIRKRDMRAEEEEVGGKGGGALVRDLVFPHQIYSIWGEDLGLGYGRCAVV